MNTLIKIIVSQTISIILAYFYFGELITDIYTKYNPNALSFPISEASFFLVMVIFSYVFIITFLSNLWFQKTDPGVKISYLVPTGLFLLFSLILSFTLGYINFELVGYWLIAFLGGWVLAWVVNFVAGKIKR